MLKLPEERMRWGEYFFLPSPSPLSFFRPRTYRKGYYFYSPQSSTVIKSKMAATTTLAHPKYACTAGYRRHFAAKPVVALRNVSCLLRLNTSQNPKHVRDAFGFLDVFLVFGKCFGLHCVLEVFLDSGKCFWILRRVLDSGEVFLDSGMCFGFWEVFCPYEPP